jgi:hypothetical protein
VAHDAVAALAVVAQFSGATLADDTEAVGVVDVRQQHVDALIGSSG